MSEEKVNVVFGAQLGGLLAGVKEAEEAIKGLREPVDEFVGSLKGIAEATGLAFATEKLSEFAAEMGELGEKAVNMGAALGVSAEQFNTLSESMQLVGGDGDALVRTLRLVSRAAETAIGQDLSRQADAFRALRIDAASFAETLRTQPIEALKELADAAVKTGNTSVTGALGFILGRGGGPELFKYFSEGAEGIERLQKEVTGLGAPTQGALEDLAKFQEEVNALKVAFTNLGAAIVDALGGPLTSFANYLKDNLVTLQDWTHYLSGTGRGQVALAPGMEERTSRFQAGRQAISDHPGASNKDQMRLWALGAGYDWEHTQALMGNAGWETGGSFSPSQTGIGGAKGLFGWTGDRAQNLPEDIAGQMEKMDRELEKLDPAFRTAAGSAEELTARFEKAFEKAGKPALAGRIAEAERAGEPAAAAGESSKGAEKIQIENSAAMKKTLDADIAAIHDELKIKEASLDLEIQKERANEEQVSALKQKKIDVAEDASQREIAINAKAPAYIRKDLTDTLVRVTELEKQKVAEQQKAQDKIFAMTDAAAQNEVKVNNDALKQLQASLAQQVTHRQITEEQATRILTAETEKRYQAELQAFNRVKALTDLTPAETQKVNQQIEALTAAHNARMEALAEQLAKQQQKWAQETEKDFTGFFNTIGSSFTSTVTGLIERTTTWGKAMQSLFDSVLSGFIKLIGEMIAKWAASGLASIFGIALSPGMGLGGVLGAGIGKLFGFEQGGIVPSAAGGWALPSMGPGGTLANLHSNEMVLPSNISSGLQNAINAGTFGGGGGHVFNMNISAMDGASIMRAGPALVQSINVALRNGAALRPNGSY